MKWFNNLAKEMQDKLNNNLQQIGEEAEQDLSHLKLKDEVLQFPTSNNAQVPESADSLITQGYTVIEGNTGKIIGLGEANSEVRILSLSKLWQPIIKKEGTNMNREEFLDRCHWVYGECGGTNASNCYAFAIENLSKASGRVEGVTRVSTEEGLKQSAWKDSTHSYTAGTVKTGNEPYSAFNTARTKLANEENEAVADRLNEDRYFNMAIKEVIWAHFRWKSDPVRGAYYWAASEQAIKTSLALSAPLFEAFGFVNIEFEKSGGTFRQTFYQIRRK